MISLLLESGNHSTGWDRHCARSIQCGSPTDWDRHTCRVASFVCEDQDGQPYNKIEPDARHLGCVLRDLGLHGIRTKSLSSYGFKLEDKEPTLRSREPPLNRQETTMYRSCVMRLAYLAQERGDFGEPVKCLARSMATPTAGSHTRVEEGRSLLERPKTSHIEFQTTDLSKVYHHLRRQRPSRLQVDTKTYYRDGPTVGHTDGQEDM